ncbi:hypothetical protein DDR33_00590 [Pararcticibacter amylolyticus]|uniref:Uncharacterized protein n=1 Tax=Pararcticibacter amylolyticus TaxID=2173175 RepID=A0A2U2PLX7_9SPHI|nr:hypothetical protein DDR33_00590 [Pararcticibacter amylolyticus]
MVALIFRKGSSDYNPSISSEDKPVPFAISSTEIPSFLNFMAMARFSSRILASALLRSFSYHPFFLCSSGFTYSFASLEKEILFFPEKLTYCLHNLLKLWLYTAS